MKIHLRFLVLFLSSVAALSAGTIVQYSSYVGLLERLFDGFVPLGAVLPQGNHGVGTTDHLDGELVVLDGVAYRINFAGKVERVGAEETTPYITIAEVGAEPDLVFTLPPGATYAQLTSAVRDGLGAEFQQNYPYAVRIEGTFATVKTRSIAKQEKPYRALTEIAQHQSVFLFADSAFTLIGFWNPPYAEAFNPPAWHIHGLNASRTAGGHVLGFEAGDRVVVKLWKMTGFAIHLPDTREFAEADFTKDVSAEVQKVNRDK